VELEDESGAPRRQVECPYCKGAKNNLWVAEKREVRTHNYNANRLIGKGGMLFLTGLAWQTNHLWPSYDGSTGSSWLLLAHWGVWILVVLGWVAMFMHPHRGVKPGRRSSKHAPGFTTDRERMALGLTAAGIALKGKHDARMRQLDRIEADLNKGQGPPDIDWGKY
jgi:hypothetical protein